MVNAVEPRKDPKGTVRAKKRLPSRKVTSSYVASAKKLGTSDHGALNPRIRFEDKLYLCYR